MGRLGIRERGQERAAALVGREEFHEVRCHLLAVSVRALELSRQVRCLRVRDVVEQEAVEGGRLLRRGPPERPLRPLDEIVHLLQRRFQVEARGGLTHNRVDSALQVPDPDHKQEAETDQHQSRRGNPDDNIPQRPTAEQIAGDLGIGGAVGPAERRLRGSVQDDPLLVPSRAGADEADVDDGVAAVLPGSDVEHSALHPVRDAPVRPLVKLHGPAQSLKRRQVLDGPQELLRPGGTAPGALAPRLGVGKRDGPDSVVHVQRLHVAGPPADLLHKPLVHPRV
mmetsp:Transcript_32559/g.77226  ORF Transcript_32559/g.77226 Transcript_32559/m.77226 type:complete len:282 (-) Transcript_32559:193-1038(-)